MDLTFDQLRHGLLKKNIHWMLTIRPSKTPMKSLISLETESRTRPQSVWDHFRQLSVWTLENDLNTDIWTAHCSLKSQHLDLTLKQHSVLPSLFIISMNHNYLMVHSYIAVTWRQLDSQHVLDFFPTLRLHFMTALICWSNHDQKNFEDHTASLIKMKGNYCPKSHIGIV